MQIYSPRDAEEEQFHNRIYQTTRQDIVIIMGDFIARVDYKEVTRMVTSNFQSERSWRKAFRFFYH